MQYTSEQPACNIKEKGAILRALIPPLKSADFLLSSVKLFTEVREGRTAKVYVIRPFEPQYAVEKTLQQGTELPTNALHFKQDTHFQDLLRSSNFLQKSVRMQIERAAEPDKLARFPKPLFNLLLHIDLGLATFRAPNRYQHMPVKII